ncbi:hypothetical protein FDZ71_05605, partial [bacterium]
MHLSRSSLSRPLLAALLALSITLLAVAGGLCAESKDSWEIGKPKKAAKTQKAPKAALSAPKGWLSVRYGELVERGTITHSGRTIGGVLN